MKYTPTAEDITYYRERYPVDMSDPAAEQLFMDRIAQDAYVIYLYNLALTCMPEEYVKDGWKLLLNQLNQSGQSVQA